ncbi:MAG: flagellar biosynthesis anti-sigma factor FlgM [Porticoccaceae bacterium]
MKKSPKKTKSIDPQRIANVRTKLTNGTYQIDADRIARRLLDLEKHLF